MRSRLILAIVATAIALALSGCNAVLEGFGDKDAQSCECDTLAVTVASIDWTGDGGAPDKTRHADVAETGQYPVVVDATYGGVTTVAARDRLFEHVASTMAAIGIAPVHEPGPPGGDRYARYVGESWELSVSTHSSSEELFLLVRADAPDEKAPEHLAPLIDAFGTR